MVLEPLAAVTVALLPYALLACLGIMVFAIGARGLARFIVRGVRTA